jgi:hypothetical protein
MNVYIALFVTAFGPQAAATVIRAENDVQIARVLSTARTADTTCAKLAYILTSDGVAHTRILSCDDKNYPYVQVRFK